MAFGFSILGNEGETQKRVQKLKELDSTNQFVDFTMALVSEQNGDFEGAAAHMEDALSRHPTSSGYVSTLGFYYGRLGKRDKASEILKKMNGLPDDTFGKPFRLAMVHAGLGDKDQMFRYLDMAFEERSILFRALRYARFDPSIRMDGRYISLFGKAKLRP